MYIKIEKGTAKSGLHLCDKCAHSRSRTHGDGHVERQCAVNEEDSQWAVLRNSNVVECSVFQKGGETSLHAMYSIAWTWYKRDDGQITFVDTNAMHNPQVVSRRLTRWQRIRRYFRRDR